MWTVRIDDSESVFVTTAESMKTSGIKSVEILVLWGSIVAETDRVEEQIADNALSTSPCWLSFESGKHETY